MKRDVVTCLQPAVCATVFAILVFTHPSSAQEETYERTFPQSQATVEKILKLIQSSLFGHLQVLDGFAVAFDRPLERYRRGYYQATVRVSSTASGGSIVRVSAKVTAWYTDPVSSHSGYELVTSNGRLEADILDQLSERLAITAPAPESTSGNIKLSAKTLDSAQGSVSAPTSRLAESPLTFSSSLSQSVAAQEKAALKAIAREPTDHPNQSGLQSELEQLQELLKNQVHPKHLAAVKKAGVAVVSAPSLVAKTLFLASAHDEFEIVDFNQDWVHVRISGLSRGWIWRDELEMPDDIPSAPGAGASPAGADLFRITREETAPFPGDWEPLRGKSVRIISVQKTEEVSKNGGRQTKQELAKSLFEKYYSELAQNSQNPAGIVLIFDSSDGGMIAATESTLEKWKAGTFSDAALWHHCFFDPPETFTASGTPAIQ